MKLTTTQPGVLQAFVAPPVLAGALYVLAEGVSGFALTPRDLQRWAVILDGYDADVLRFAALEYVRQRSRAPEDPGALGQFVGWLQRAIADARPKYSRRDKAIEPDTFAAQFLAACGNDTRAFVRARASAPRACEDDQFDQPEQDNLPARIAVNREELARAERAGDAERVVYFTQRIERLEAQQCSLN